MIHSHLARGGLFGLILSCVLGSSSVQASELTGTWTGFYACGQGKTAFTMTLDDTGHGAIEFGPHPGNPSIPSGGYEVEVSSAAENVTIVAGEWITQPHGYVAVDMEGVLSDDRQALTGRVNNATCTTFDLSRQDSGEDEAAVVAEALTSQDKPDVEPDAAPEETVPPGGVTDPDATAPEPDAPVADLAPVQPGTEPGALAPPTPEGPIDMVVIPGVDWPDGTLRLIDAAGFRIVLDLTGEPCTAPSFSVEIDAPAILPLVQRNMAGTMSLAYNPFERSGTCGMGSWDLEVGPIPVFYLGQQAGTIEGLILPGVSGRPTSYAGPSELPLSSDPAVSAEQAVLNRYWTAALQAESGYLFYQAEGDNGWLSADDRQALLASDYASRQAAEVVILVADGIPALEDGPCSAPWLATTADVTRLRRAAELGSSLAACRLAAVLERDFGLDLESVARGKVDLSVAPFAGQAAHVEAYLEATCHRASAFRRGYWSGMFHTVALDAARNEFEAATAYLKSNPGQPCSRFAALGSRLRLSDADTTGTAIKGDGLPGTGFGDPPKVPKNDLFDLADDAGVAYAAGFATEVVKCDLSLSSAETTVIQRFALNGMVVAGGGSDYRGPHIIESILASGAGFAAGLAAGRALGCTEPEATEGGAAIVDLVDQARDEGDAFGRPFLNACEANSSVFGAEGCECAAQVGLVVLPDIYTRTYEDGLLEEIGRQNPALYLNILSLCNSLAVHHRPVRELTMGPRLPARLPRRAEARSRKPTELAPRHREMQRAAAATEKAPLGWSGARLSCMEDGGWWRRALRHPQVPSPMREIPAPP